MNASASPEAAASTSPYRSCSAWARSRASWVRQAITPPTTHTQASSTVAT